MMHKVTDLQPWECLMKRIVWKQLGDIRDKKILDFDSGIGVTANYLAEHNDVTAIEPDDEWLHAFYYFNDEIPTEADFERTMADYLTFEFNMITHGRGYLFEKGGV